MISSTYNPARWSDVEASKIRPNTIGIQSVIIHGTVQNTDTLIADDCLVRSIEFICENSNFGDTVTIQIIDLAGTYAPAGTILSTPVSNYVVIPVQQKSSYDAIAPFKLLGGLTVRIIYTSTGSTDVSLGVNFIFAKLLI